MGHRKFVSAALAVAVSGCQVVGPESIEIGRVRYNEAIENTSADQLLTNIARVYRNETPLSLEVQQIVAGLSAGGSLGGSITGLGIGKKSGAFRAGSLTYGSLSPMLSYSEQPNVTYQPITGDALVKEFTTPIPIDLIVKLYRSSWSLLPILEMITTKLTDNDDDYGAALNGIVALDDLNALELAAASSSAADDKAPKMPSGSTSAPKPASDSVPDTLTLYFVPPKTCKDKQQALIVWRKLLVLYGENQPRTAASSASSRSQVENSSMCPETDRQIAGAPGALKLNAASLAAAGRQTGPVNDVTVQALQPRRIRLATSPAYGVLKGVIDSRFSPAEIIQVVTPGLYRQIRSELWNKNTPDWYALLTRDVCAGESQRRCETLRKSGDDVNEQIDNLISRSGPDFVYANGSAAVEDNLNQRRRLILVQVSPEPPEDAFKVVDRDGLYFYIGRDDPTSQRNFALLQLLVSVQAVASSPAPQQSISVGAH